MGGGSKGSSNQTSTFQPPAFALAGGQQAVQTAQQLAQTPFEIPVQPIAPLQPMQQEALQEVENVQGMAQPYFNAGTALNLAGSQPNIGQYFGAETAGVLPEMQNIFGQQMEQATGDMVQKAGGIGADRVAVGQAELANQQGLSAGQTLSEIMRNSVSQAQSGAGLEQSAGNNIAQMGRGAQEAALQGATAELQGGTLTQQQLQNQSNSVYENILQQISWPFQTNQYLGSMSAGVTPAMGGTGITSGNTKGAMMNTGGLGKGAAALGGKMAGGGRVGGDYEDDGMEGGPQAFDNIDPKEFAFGGAVNPLEIATGSAPPLPMPMAGGGNAFSGGTGNGFSFVPSFDTAGGFAPASGQIVQVPFGPDFGGPQPLELTTAGVPPPPNLSPGNFSFPTTPSGTEGLNIRGPQGAPTFQNKALSQDKDNPFSGLLSNLYAERAQLMGASGSGIGGFMGPGGGTGAGGWASMIGSAAGSGGAHHKRGGVARRAEGGQLGPNIASLIFGQMGGAPGAGTSPQGEQKNTSGAEVGNLLGSNPDQNPSGGHTVIPQSNPQGRPSPMMQWAMTNRQQDPMKLAQQAASGAGSFNPFAKQHAQPSDQTMNDPGQTLAAPGIGGKGGAGPGNEVGPPPSDGAQADPGPFDVADFGGDFGGDIFAATGGAIMPAHMDIGGDPLSEGMASSSPFTPQGEISGSVLPYNIESAIYNQPFQVADSGQAPAGGGSGSGSAPFNPAAGPVAPSGPSDTDFTAQMGVTSSPFDLPKAQNQPAAGAQAPGAAPSSGGDKEQDAVKALGIAASKPLIPTPQPRPASAPGVPGAGGAVSAAPAGPQEPPGVAKARQLLAQPVGNLVKQFGMPAMTPDQQMTGRQWWDAHPEYRGEVTQNLAKAGITPQDLQAAMQPQPQTQAQPSAQTAGISRPDFTGQHSAPVATRTNNPFNQWPSAISQRFGGTRSLGPMNGGRDNPAIFPDAVSGAAAGFALMGSSAYTGKTMEQAIYKWANGTDPSYPNFVSRQSGVPLDQRITPEFLASDKGIAMMKAMAQYENGTQKGPYPLSDEHWKMAAKEGLAGAPSEGERTAVGAPAPDRGTAASGEYGPLRASEKGELRPVSRMGQFLTTLGTGDPTAYFRGRMAELGLYKEAAAWDAMREAQYGPPMTPMAAGAKTADDLIGGPMSVRGMMGKVAGASELAGHPGTISGDAAAGHAASSPGATVTPTGGGAPGGGPPASPPLAGGAGAPMSATEKMLDKGMRLLASGNPQAIAAGNQLLNGMAQRGLVDAQTIQERIKAAGMSFGWNPFFGGAYRLDPKTGAAHSLMPGGGSGPGVLPPPAPGTTPAATSGTPAGAAAPALGAMSTGTPPPSPAGGMPTPLPTGAEPAPHTSSTSPSAPDIMAEPAFAPRGSVPGAPWNTMQLWKQRPDAMDTRTFPGNPAAKQVQEEAADYIKDLDKKVLADQTVEQQLAQLDIALSHLPKTGFWTPGSFMNERMHFANTYNTLVNAFGLQGSLPEVDGQKLGSVQEAAKLTNQLGFQLARTLGAREAMQIVQQAVNSVPGANLSPQGSRMIMEGLRAVVDQDRDKQHALQQWLSTNSGSINGFERWFNETHPGAMYANRALALAGRDKNDTPISKRAFEALKARPDRVDAFERQYGIPGVGRYFLENSGAGAAAGAP